MSTFSEWAPVVAWRKSFGGSGTVPTAVPEPPEYAGAREEAQAIARGLGLDISNEHWEKSSIGDFLRLCYAQGWKACEAKMMSPNRADEIATVLEHPEKLIRVGTNGAYMPSETIRAVQQAAVYGVPKRVAGATT